MPNAILRDFQTLVKRENCDPGGLFVTKCGNLRFICDTLVKSGKREVSGRKPFSRCACERMPRERAVPEGRRTFPAP